MGTLPKYQNMRLRQQTTHPRHGTFEGSQHLVIYTRIVRPKPVVCGFYRPQKTKHSLIHTRLECALSPSDITISAEPPRSQIPSASANVLRSDSEGGSMGRVGHPARGQAPVDKYRRLPATPHRPASQKAPVVMATAALHCPAWQRGQARRLRGRRRQSDGPAGRRPPSAATT